MKSYFYLIIVGALILLSNTSLAQYLQDINGNPVTEKTYENVEGSPYLFEDWKTSTVKLKNGKAYKDVETKLNLLTEELLFKDLKGNVLIFVDEVLEVKLGGILLRAGYRPTEGRTQKSFYQILSDGGTALVKRRSKSVVEEKPFNSATVQKKIMNTESYYLARNNELIKIKKDKKTILEALGNKTPELEKYIASNKLNLKDEGDIAKLIGYYNSI